MIKNRDNIFRGESDFAYSYADFAYHYYLLEANASIDCRKIKIMTTSNNHEISLQDAIDMTTLYRANRPANFPICETFEVDAINKLLATDGCAFFRIYYGMKQNLDVDAILVAVNDAGEDILPAENKQAISMTNTILLEDGYRCPEACPPRSPLNGG